MSWLTHGCNPGLPKKMDLHLLEPHSRTVMEAFRSGEFDGLEILGQADEKAFFDLCLR